MHSFSFISIASLFLLLSLNFSSAFALNERLIKSNSDRFLNQQTILIMGDSLSAAYNIEIQSSWPHLLQKKFDSLNSNVKIINASISGETTFGGKNRISTLLKQHKPSIVIIELGGNDGLRGLNLSISQQNIAAMVQLTQTANSNVLLIGVRLPPNLGRRYNTKFQAMYQAIADTHGVSYLPKFLAGVAENKKLMQRDGIHPVAKAQPLLQDKVFKALLTM